MQPQPDLFQLFLSLIGPALQQFAPYLVSGAILSHIIAQLAIIDKDETPDFVKIAIAFGVALLGVVGNNLLTGHYAGGDAIGVYLADTLKSAGLLLGGMTIPNVTLDKFIPSLSKWAVDTLTRLVVAVRKGVDILINQGKPPVVGVNG